MKKARFGCIGRIGFYFRMGDIMKPIVNCVTELVGETPMLRAHRFAKACGIETAPILKLEYLNPTGSVKDRAALKMIEDAEKAGKLQFGAVIIEPTSGNTGIGLASVAAARGYRVILTMPDTMSVERRKLLAVYGAEIVLTPGADGMRGSIQKAEELARSIENSFIPAQFENPANPAAHVETTGPEIYSQTDGAVDIFVAGIGTGGTITGTARYLKAQKPQVQVVGVEPASSPLITTGKSGAHGLQGIGANFVPENYDASVVDAVMPITEEEAYAAAKLLAKTEGILVGITSGAALAASVKLLKQAENKGKTLVALLPDSGDRYFSTPIFD